MTADGADDKQDDRRYLTTTFWFRNPCLRASFEKALKGIGALSKVRGTEMGMLIRRLKQRLREGGREGDFTCIATSATIVSNDGKLQAVADFASVLFGETFSEKRVILGESAPVGGTPRVELSAEDYGRLRGAGKADLLDFARDKGLEVDPRADIPALLGSILLSDSRTLRLIDALKEPVLVADLARSLFGEAEDDKATSEALEQHIDVLCKARRPSGEPLVTLRYHHFLRALEGAYVSFCPTLSVSLERGSKGEGARFELAICQECGQEFIVGQIRDGRLQEAIRDPSSDEFGVSYFLPLGPPEYKGLSVENAVTVDAPSDAPGGERADCATVHSPLILSTFYPRSGGIWHDMSNPMAAVLAAEEQAGRAFLGKELDMTTIRRPQRFTEEELAAARQRLAASEDRGSDDEYAEAIAEVYEEFEDLRRRAASCLISR